MELRLSDRSTLPLREQIVRRIRELILRGELPEHYPLPSLRGLARKQRVGVVTVQRAYEDLERERMIYSRQGKGFFVAPIGGADRSVRTPSVRSLTRSSRPWHARFTGRPETVHRRRHRCRIPGWCPRTPRLT